MPMKRGLLSVRRDPMWSAWDMDCKSIVRTKPEFRAKVRRTVKHRQNNALRREVDKQTALCNEESGEQT